MDKTGFLQDASAPLLDALSDGAITLKLKTGEMLFDQDDHGDSLYILDDGLLEVSIYSAAGRKLSLNRIQPDSVFGEIAIFDPGPRTACVTALAPSTLRAIKHAALTARITQEPALATEFLRLAGQRMRQMGKQIEDQVFLPPAARLAAKMLLLADQTGQIAMSQAQLADFVGVTREVVSKTLSEWRRIDIVTLSRGKIAINDRQALLRLRDAYFSDTM